MAAPYCPAERVINNKGDFRYEFLVLSVLIQIWAISMFT